MEQRNNRTLVEQWDIGKTTEQKKATPRNTTTREPRYIEQIAWQNTKQKIKEFYGKVTLGHKVLSCKKFIRKWRVKYFHKGKNVVKLKLFSNKKDTACLYFFILFSLFNLITWSTCATVSTYHQTNVCERKMFGRNF